MSNANNPALEAQAVAAHEAEVRAVIDDIQASRGITNAAEPDFAEALELLGRIEPKQRPANLPKPTALAASVNTNSADSLSPQALAAYQEILRAVGSTPSQTAQRQGEGRSYDELSNQEKDRLWRTDPATFWRIRADRNARVSDAILPAPPLHNGKRYEQLEPLEKDALSREQPEVFAHLRADWVARGEPVER